MRLSSSLGWFINPAIFTLHFVPGKIYSLAIVGSGPANFPAFALRLAQKWYKVGPYQL